MQRTRQGRGSGVRAAAAAAIAACLGLAACSMPKEVNPVWIAREISGAADADRPPPPGLDQPFPNLASVPPRPERPPAATREAISAALREDRALSRGPLVLRSVPGPEGFPAPAPGEPALPSGPPPRPALAGAPRIPWTEAPPPSAPRPTAPAAAPASRPGSATPVLPEMPREAPPPPPPDLLGGPPAPPGSDLLGIPPPPGPDLLAPPRPR